MVFVAAWWDCQWSKTCDSAGEIWNGVDTEGYTLLSPGWRKSTLNRFNCVCNYFHTVYRPHLILYVVIPSKLILSPWHAKHTPRNLPLSYLDESSVPGIDFTRFTRDFNWNFHSNQGTQTIPTNPFGIHIPISHIFPAFPVRKPRDNKRKIFLNPYSRINVMR